MSCGEDSGPAAPDDNGKSTGDNRAPVVNITNPTAGDTLSGTTTFSCTATDTSGIAEVYFELRDLCDSVVASITDDSPPFDGTIDADTLLDGEFNVCAAALDSAGNTSDWTCVGVFKGETDVEINGFAPLATYIGAQSTVLGENFGADNGKGRVVVLGVDAAITAWTDTTVEFTIPAVIMEDTKMGIDVIVDCLARASTEIDVTHTGVTRLTDDFEVDGEPCWGPSGNWIYFSSMRSGNYDIWRVPATGGDAEQITTDPLGDNWADIHPISGELAWGSQRSHLLHNPENDYEIFTGQPKCSHSCTVNIETENDYIDRTPAWAPQPVMGYNLVYTAHPSSGGGATPTITLIGQGQPLALTEGENPNFSPNAKEVVYQLDGSIYKIEVGLGTTPVRLTNGNSDGVPHWSWVNNQIVYQTWTLSSGNRDIYVMNADGSNQRRLIPGSVEELTPTWSPDGKKVVFMSNRWWNYDIYVYEVQ